MSALDEPVETLMRGLCLEYENSPVVEKAIQLLQRVNAMCPGNRIKHGATCKPLICIQIACELYGIAINQKNVLKLAHTTKANYLSALDYVKSILNVESKTITFQALGVQWGCQMITPHAEMVFEQFKKEWDSKLTAAERCTIDWGKDVYKTATFWLCCKAIGVQLNKRKLIESSGFKTTLRDLNKHIKLVEEATKPLLAELAARKHDGRKRKNDTIDDDDNSEDKNASKRTKHEDVRKSEPVSGICDMLGTTCYRRSRKYTDYIKWRDYILGLAETNVAL
ncbi:11314_t:CDS:2 [Paraglomus brasilianum]|uniref:11314_t:CDS:1 n=1 Tax=Paraglomus brasilianum TaxID=144538 RepID=A0A9N9FMV9_9GLOM|nr:11314_t:CDS:2 [Paraglomus brasilianum]